MARTHETYLSIPFRMYSTGERKTRPSNGCKMEGRPIIKLLLRNYTPFRTVCPFQSILRASTTICVYSNEMIYKPLTGPGELYALI